MGAKSINSAIELSLLELGSIVRMRKGQLVTQQFAKATSFYVLKTGVVSFSLVIDDAVGAIAVGQLNAPDTPVGWSGFSSPGRYATSVSVESHSATFYTWPLETLQEYFQSHPDTGTRFLQMICANARNLIKMSIDLLGTHGPAIEKDLSIEHVDFQIADASPDEDLIQFLRKSSFFEIFDEAPLEFLSQSIENRVYQTNDLIYGQGHSPEGIYILARGKVRFSHYNENMQNASFRQVSNAGYIVGWSGAVNLPNLINAHAARETLLYFISNKDLERILRLHPDFAYAFYLRLLWLVGYQLQAIRVRIIAAKFNHEVIAIGNLIDQNSTKLDLASSLHKVPHLLDNKLTVNDALHTLEAIKSSGTTLEKNIALTALEILDEIKREHKFYSGLVNVYKHVIKSPETVPAEAIRKKNAEDYQNIFNEQHYKISGLENLPEKTGNIFIYNHLRNHSHNTLPNQFQITLDSHFISAMILMKRYGDPGLRIVRIGQGVEYAHQEYYQRLGHIDVFTEDAQNKTKKDKKRVRQMFYHEAGKYVQSGGNLIISPEGNSYGTEESPGPFKPGAFQLAISIKKEPLIVPIALANFDRRIRNNCFSCVILPPFKASDYIRDPSDKEEMKKFLHEYQHTYRTYVEMAIAQSKEYMWTSN